jgi:predicted DNA binding CopG/RHH family protein
MKKTETKHRVIPVRFGPDDLSRIQREAEALRLSVPTYIRMMMTKEIEPQVQA